LPEENKASHVYKEDPYGDKEDTRPVELKKKPCISIDWEKLKRWIEGK